MKSVGSSGEVSRASSVSGRSSTDGMSEELRIKLELKKMEMEDKKAEREARREMKAGEAAAAEKELEKRKKEN